MTDDHPCRYRGRRSRQTGHPSTYLLATSMFMLPTPEDIGKCGRRVDAESIQDTVDVPPRDSKLGSSVDSSQRVLMSLLRKSSCVAIAINRGRLVAMP
jgi:hypothetical protein